MTQEENIILSLLESNTYDLVREKTGWSRGRIYNSH